MFKLNGEQYVIEYQCTPIATEYVERHDLYKAAGIKDIWIAGTEKYFSPNSRRKFLEDHIVGYYNPETKELTTVDAAGNCDIWDNIEILDLYKDADYWKDIDENNEVFVWAKISTNGTKSINDDEAVVFPGNYSVFKDHAKIFILDGEIIVKEK